MKMHMPQNPLALAVAGLALVVATTGTAYAVVSSVSIADPVVPSRKQRVDSTGRALNRSIVSGTVTSQVQGTVVTRELPSTVLNRTEFLALGDNVVFGPTRTRLAVDRISLMNTGENAGRVGTNFLVSIVQKSVPVGQPCSAVGTHKTYGLYRTAPGSDAEHTYPTPLVFRPVGTQAYCVMLDLFWEGATAPAGYYMPFAQVTGYVAAGTYQGPGLAPSPLPAKAPLATKANPRPAGSAPRG